MYGMHCGSKVYVQLGTIKETRVFGYRMLKS